MICEQRNFLFYTKLTSNKILNPDATLISFPADMPECLNNLRYLAGSFRGFLKVKASLCSPAQAALCIAFIFLKTYTFNSSRLLSTFPFLRLNHCWCCILYVLVADASEALVLSTIILAFLLACFFFLKKINIACW